jgi:hypothetical protein
MSAAAASPETAGDKVEAKRQALLVLGMHRSGTSAVTRVASLLGAAVPVHVMGANEANPQGHWEPAELVAAHDSLLRAAGSDWHDWKPFDASFWETPDGAARKEELRRLLASEYRDGSFLVMKDPRICRFADAWLEILREAGYTPYVILPTRNPLEIARSLLERDGLAVPYGLLLWLRHILDAEHFSRGTRRTFLAYDELLEDWAGAMSRVAGQLGLQWPVSFESAKPEVERFLVPSLRHHHISMASLLEDPAISSWVKDTYRALVQLTLNPEDPAAMRSLDEVRKNLGTAAQAFGRSACPEHEPVVGYRLAQRQLESMQARLNEIESVSEQRHALLVQFEQIWQERKAIDEQRQATIARLEQAVAARPEESSQRAAEIAELRNRLQESEQRQATLLLEVERARRGRSAVEQLRFELEEAQHRLSARLSMLEEDNRRITAQRDTAARAAVEVRGRLAKSYRWAASLQRWCDVHNLPPSTVFSRFCISLFARSGFSKVLQLPFTIPGTKIAACGWAERRVTWRAIAAELKRALLLSGHFDPRWYTLFQLEQRGMKPNEAIDHYIRFGLPTGFSPNGVFDVHEYQRLNPDLPREPSAALAHYILRAGPERRRVHPLFDREFYLQRNADVRAAGIDPLAHFITDGWRQNRDPHPWFSVSWYLNTYRDVADAGMNPLAHFMRFGAGEKRDPHPAFSTRDYLEAHPEVTTKGLNPLLHFVLFGEAAGFVATPSALNGIRPAAALPAEAEPEKDSPAALTFDPKAPIAVCVSGEGNFFMREIAEHLAQCLEQDGSRARVVTDREAMQETLGKILIVAPHEFFTLGSGPLLHQEARFRHAAMLNTEQPGTSWFANSLTFLAQASEVFELSASSARGLQEAGIAARVLGLPFLANSACFDGSGALTKEGVLESLPNAILERCPDADAPMAERPIEVLFVGQATEWRQQRLLKVLPGLVHRRCFLHIPEFLGPLATGGRATLSSRQVAGLSRRSKVLLNLHRSNQAYFEWHRVALQGFLQKTLVISEPLPPDCGFLADLHYVPLDIHAPEAQLAYFLDTPEGIAEAEKIRTAAYQHYAEEFPGSRCRMLRPAETAE